MPVNWDTIERLMLKSFTGGGLTETEQDLVQKAYAADPKEYGTRSKRVRAEEIIRRRTFT